MVVVESRPRRHHGIMFYRATLAYICLMLTIIVALLVWYFNLFG